MARTPELEIPLTWQQRTVLGTEAASGERLEPCAVVFEIPWTTSSAAVTNRLRTLVEAEDSLRVTAVSLRDDTATISTSVDLPLSCVDADSAAELAAISDQVSLATFPRSGAPLWNAVLVRRGASRLALCAVFDHLISDGRSLDAVRAALGEPGWAGFGGSKPFREWAVWQRTHYPVDGRAGAVSATEFWRDYLNGGPAELPLPPSALCPAPSAPLCGRVHLLRRALAFPDGSVRRASRAFRCSPFVIFLSAVACALARETCLTSVTFRVSTIGRSPGYFDTQGFFASSTPVRVDHADLADHETALSVTRAAWLRTLEHQSAPWGYVTRITGDGASRPAPDGFPATLDVNFIPYTSIAGFDADGLRAAQDEIRDGRIGALKLTLSLADPDRWLLTSEFDDGRFADSAVGALIARIGQILSDAVCGDELPQNAQQPRRTVPLSTSDARSAR
jgi:hypothetical protein